VPKDNLNTIGQRNDITLNTISLVEFRVDGGSWSAATPGDGSFDSASEAFTFTTGPLANGPHVLEARAAQANGNAEEQSAADTLVVIGSPVSVGTSTIGSADRLSAQPSLSRGAFTFRFGLAAPSRVRVAVYSPEGRAVAHLMDRELAAGPHAIPWDGRPSGGAPAPAGVYFVRLDAPGRSESARIVVVR
jgi:hypothetical protein